MNRRDLLKMIGFSPLVGLVPEAAAAESVETAVAPTTPLPEPIVKSKADLLSEQLVKNLQGYAESKPEMFLASELMIMFLACPVLCKHLIEDWDLSAPYMPEQDPQLLKDFHFDVFSGSPVGMFLHPKTGKNVELVAQARRVKIHWGSLMAAWDDIHASHGIDKELETAQIVGMEAALEIQMELRHAYSQGQLPSIYALYLPPFIMKPLLEPADFSVNRGMRIRYAKAL